MEPDRGHPFWAEGARPAHDEWWHGPVHLLFLAALLALLVLGIVWLVHRLSESRVGSTAVAAPAAGALAVPAALDPAVAELRLRYARGEVDRDAYLQAFADLAGRDEPWPGQEEPRGTG